MLRKLLTPKEQLIPLFLHALAWTRKDKIKRLKQSKNIILKNLTNFRQLKEKIHKSQKKLKTP